MCLLAWPSAVEAISDVVAHENTEEVDEKASLDALNRDEATIPSRKVRRKIGFKKVCVFPAVGF